MDEKLMSIKEVSEFTTFSPSKLRMDMKAGKLAYYKIGRRLAFLKQDVMSYLLSHRVDSCV